MFIAVPAVALGVEVLSAALVLVFAGAYWQLRREV
jgi:hypothetical protein